ncbi:MAG: hypothetical protein KAU28_10730 [Phycisphaerae bacterium]|nr:hypothetical protein [Phycisphaerae bacterium]
MGSTKQKIGYVLLLSSLAGFSLSSIILHLWTVYFAYSLYGLLAAIVTFFIPFLSELFWFSRAWIGLGTLINVYCLSVFAYLGCAIACAFLYWAGSRLAGEDL